MANINEINLDANTANVGDPRLAICTWIAFLVATLPYTQVNRIAD